MKNDKDVQELWARIAALKSEDDKHRHDAIRWLIEAAMFRQDRIGARAKDALLRHFNAIISDETANALKNEA